MTNVTGILPGSSSACAFSAQNCNQDLWYLCPSSVHITSLMTGGLAGLYENIRKRKLTTRQHVGNTHGAYTKEGRFNPTEEMPLIAKRYEFVRILTEGSTAVVILAKDTFRNFSLVAIKVLHDYNFLVGGQEADVHKLIQRADLDGTIPILKLLNTFRMDDHYCLTFKYYNSVPVDQYFKMNGWSGDKSLEVIKIVALKLFQSLSFLHQLGIIHADIKPENILLSQDIFTVDSLWLIDLGNCIKCTIEEIQTFEEDFEVQTLSYRAPEIIVGYSLSPAIDLWSVGCVLAELYLGCRLFDGSTTNEILTRMVNTLGLLPHKYITGKFGDQYEAFIELESNSSLDVSRSLKKHLQCSDDLFMNLLERLLSTTAETRITAYEALHCSFLSDIKE